MCKKGKFVPVFNYVLGHWDVRASRHATGIIRRNMAASRCGCFTQAPAHSGQEAGSVPEKLQLLWCSERHLNIAWIKPRLSSRPDNNSYYSDWAIARSALTCKMTEMYLHIQDRQCTTDHRLKTLECVSTLRFRRLPATKRVGGVCLTTFLGKSLRNHTLKR
jgi:hypothetical protein